VKAYRLNFARHPEDAVHWPFDYKREARENIQRIVYIPKIPWEEHASQLALGCKHGVRAYFPINGPGVGEVLVRYWLWVFKYYW
jgi:hypothetical protein